MSDHFTPSPSPRRSSRPRRDPDEDRPRSTYRCPHCRSREKPEWQTCRHPLSAPLQILAAVLVGFPGLGWAVAAVLFFEASLWWLALAVTASVLLFVGMLKGIEWAMTSERKCCPDCGARLG